MSRWVFVVNAASKKIALVSKLKVENLLALKKRRHKRTHKQLQTQPWHAFDLKFSSDGECWQYFSQYPKKNLVFIQFFPLLQPFCSTFNFRIFFALFSQKIEIQASFSELSEGNVKLFSSQFLPWEELGASWARRWCKGRTRSCSWLPGFGWLMDWGGKRLQDHPMQQLNACK